MQDILKNLEDFDSKHGWDFYKEAKDPEAKLELLQSEIVALLGEFGEFANIVKKCRRNNEWLIDNLKEELTDMFIFLLKISKILEIDLKKEFFDKMTLNEKRFKKFEKNKTT